MITTRDLLIEYSNRVEWFNERIRKEYGRDDRCDRCSGFLISHEYVTVTMLKSTQFVSGLHPTVIKCPFMGDYDDSDDLPYMTEEELKGCGEWYNDPDRYHDNNKTDGAL